MSGSTYLDRSYRDLLRPVIAFISIDMEEWSLKVCARIRKLRLLHDISQEAMSDSLGISLRQYQRLENGQRQWTLSQIYLLSDALHVSPSELLDIKKSIFKTAKSVDDLQELKSLLQSIAKKLEEAHKKSLPDEVKKA